MARLRRLTDIQQFIKAGSIPEAAVNELILSNVAKLNEINQIEPWLRDILRAHEETPHGPTEIADILTTKVTLDGSPKLAGFIIKGKSFLRVTSRNVDYQIAKLLQIADLQVAVLIAVGDIQDDAKRDLINLIQNNWDYLIIDRLDLARLLIAYNKICGQDGLPFVDGTCPKGHEQVREIELRYKVRQKLDYEIVKLSDLSHAGARRLAAYVLADPHYTQDTIRSLICEATDAVRYDQYVRNEMVKARWGDTPAQVVWIWVGLDLADITNATFVCGSCWIDTELDPQFWPDWPIIEDITDGIMIDWNSNYYSIKTILDEAKAGKAEIIEVVDKSIPSIISLVSQAGEHFELMCNGHLNEKRFVKWMLKNQPHIDNLCYSESLDLIPVFECRDFWQAFNNVCALAHNLWLFYAAEEFLSREPENRRLVFNQYLGYLKRDLESLQYEREKLDR